MSPTRRASLVVVSLAFALSPCLAETWYVDDDAPNDPGPGDPLISDPQEDGSPAHPFDAIQEAVDAAISGDKIRLAAGVYSNRGNCNVIIANKSIQLRSASASADCVIDCRKASPGFQIHGSGITVSITGLRLINARGALGGALRCTGGAALDLANCEIHSCRADVGGALLVLESTASIRNCLIHSNQAVGGGGIASVIYSTVLVEGTTLVRNEADIGGGILNATSDLTLANSILHYNQAFEAGPALALGAVATAKVRYCVLEGGPGDVRVPPDCILNWGLGNFEETPLFIDADGPDNNPDTPADNNYRLKTASPLLDAGDPAFVPGAEETDLDGRPRVLNRVVDLGAYESACGDLNCDAILTFDDIAPFALAITDPAAYESSFPDCSLFHADCNHDGLVDHADITPFLRRVSR